MRLMGMQVVVTPFIQPVQAIKTSPDFEWCTDAFRAKHDAWLLELFGTVDEVLVMDGKIFMSPANAARIKNIVPNGGGKPTAANELNEG